MKEFKNKTGYILTKDVKSTQRDRRVTGDWRKKDIIPTGKMFFYRDARPNVIVSFATLHPMVGGYHYAHCLVTHDPLFKALAPYLVEVPDTLKTILLRYDIEEADIVRFLVMINQTSIGFLDGIGPDVAKMVGDEIKAEELAEEN